MRTALHARTSLALALPLLVAGVACGDDEGTSGAGGGGGPGGAGGASNATATTGSSPTSAIASLRAPTRTSLQVKLEGDALAAPLDAKSWEITLNGETLGVGNVEYDPATKTVTMETAKQKLGVTYQLVVRAPGDPLDLTAKSFVAADSATFWAVDFDGFTDYEVVADRLGVGEHIVIYGEQGLSVDEVEASIAEFDSLIYPKESELFRAPPDVDENGRVVVLALDGGGYFAGYFNPADTLTDEEAQQFGQHSNELEMLYVSTPDTGGVVDTRNTVPHEYLHLLYEAEHPFSSNPQWNWHNEGLAECAVHAVHGINQIAADYFLVAPELAIGASLVQWQYGNYAQYVQAYVFLTYAASRLGGVEGYATMFALDGSPASVGGLFSAQLGASFGEVQRDALAASWVQAPSGSYGFSGMLPLSGKPQVVPFGSPSADLLPFEGVLLAAPSNALAVLDAGPNVVHLGVDANSVADASSPFDVAGGVVVALSGNADPESTATEPSGSLSDAIVVKGQAGPRNGKIGRNLPKFVPGSDPSWRHPPPLDPRRDHAATRAWRRAVYGR
jgi:hypothetical protein